MKDNIQELIPAEVGDVYKTSKTGHSKDMVVILGASLALAIVLVIWAAFLRKRRRHRDHALVRFSAKKHHRKHRSRHAYSRRRNPTLAETGGLPPVRSDHQPEA
jgi:hypothetical protein